MISINEQKYRMSCGAGPGFHTSSSFGTRVNVGAGFDIAGTFGPVSVIDIQTCIRYYVDAK